MAETLVPPDAPPAVFLPDGLLTNVGRTEAIHGLHLLHAGKPSHTTDLRDAPVLHTQTLEETSTKFNLRSNHPLVTLSYLHTGTAEITALEQSWSSTFMRAGCSAFMGPLWAVEPTVEAAFVNTFYARLWAGEALGDAFRAARELTRMVVPNSIDYLAYVLFGDPMARPYRLVEGKGYTTVDPVGREKDDLVKPGTSVRFRVSLRRHPPIWHEGRIIEAQALNFKHIKVAVITFGLQVTPATPITLMRASTGDYVGWFSLTVPTDSKRTDSLVQVHFVDMPDADQAEGDEFDRSKPIHTSWFTIPIAGGEITGKSEAIGMDKKSMPLHIFIDEKEYSMGVWKYTRTAHDLELENFTQNILGVFHVLEKAVNARKKIELPKELCHEQLVKLAEWGMIAYRKFFEDEKARKDLNESISWPNGVPTFVYTFTPFPWEVLYEGNDDADGDPEMFWGLRYTPARILNPETNSVYPDEQTLPLDMLFCLHHKLIQSHRQERPMIEQLVLKGLGKNRFNVLGEVGCSLTKLADPEMSGKVLLQYLDTSTHNIVHFACHCERDERSYGDGNDTLLFSLINNEQIDSDVPVICLKTKDFYRVTSKFKYRPLVFLNACQSAGGAPDELGKTFNLPKVFIKHDAAAVIATICPIPDRFAAAFARQFYYYFLDQHMTIGDALRAARWYFLKVHNNPLGLAYGLYSPAHYRVVASPVEG